ncbi:MAG: ATP-binding cassette domain-containing protein [Acidimicrobiales bacterium]
MIAISVEHLSKSYGRTRALVDVSFAVPSGSIVALLGRNGAGKTTLIRILTTLLQADSGSAFVVGSDVRDDAGGVRRRIGVSGQTATMDDLLTGRQNLVIIGRLCHLKPTKARERAAELLQRFDLEAASDRLVRTYSGGMRRRLDLAASLVAEPEVLFFDEPTTGLDPISRAEMWESIRGLAGRGVTILLTTQYLDEADQLAHRVVVINEGLVVADGTPEELKSSIGWQRIRVTLAVFDPTQMERARALLPGAEIVGRFVQAPAPDGLRSLIQAADRLAAAGLEVHEVALEHPTLDEVFSAVTTEQGVEAAVARRGRDGGSDEREHRGGDVRIGEVESPAVAVQGGRFPSLLVDSYNAARRYVLRGMRQPDVIIGSVLMPVIFVVLFGYVFGSSITVPGGNYRSYLMPGLFAMSALFTSNMVAVAVATDMQGGVVDRMRTLPMARSALVVGQSVAWLILWLPALLVMIGCALLVGWRPTTGVGSVIAGFLLIELFAYAFSWIGILVGLTSRGIQAADTISAMPPFLLGFVSNVFVDPSEMPAWLRDIANWNPVSALVAGVRDLFGNSIGPPPSGVWSLAHPVASSAGMCGLLLIILVPLCVRIYTRTAR